MEDEKSKEERKAEAEGKGEEEGDNPEDVSDRELVSCELVRVVLDLTNVLVSPSSVVTEICDVSPCGSDREFVEPQSFFFFLQKAGLDSNAGRGEVRRLTSESAPAFKKKDDTANTNAKFVHLFEREQGSYEEDGREWNARERTIIARTKQNSF